MKKRKLFLRKEYEVYNGRFQVDPFREPPPFTMQSNEISRVKFVCNDLVVYRLASFIVRHYSYYQLPASTELSIDFKYLKNTADGWYKCDGESANKTFVEDDIRGCTFVLDDGSQIPLFQSCSYVQNPTPKILVKMNINLEDEYIGLVGGFTTVSQSDLMLMKSLPQAKFYTLLKSHTSSFNGEFIVRLEWLIEYLGIRPNTYSPFRIRILEPYQKYFEEQLKFKFEFEGLRLSRTINRIKFKVPTKRRRDTQGGRMLGKDDWSIETEAKAATVPKIETDSSY